LSYQPNSEKILLKSFYTWKWIWMLECYLIHYESIHLTLLFIFNSFAIVLQNCFILTLVAVCVVRGSNNVSWILNNKKPEVKVAWHLPFKRLLIIVSKYARRNVTMIIHDKFIRRFSLFTCFFLTILTMMMFWCDHIICNMLYQLNLVSFIMIVYSTTCNIKKDLFS
jgi:hypothetical protein